VAAAEEYALGHRTTFPVDSSHPAESVRPGTLNVCRAILTTFVLMDATSDAVRRQSVD